MEPEPHLKSEVVSIGRNPRDDHFIVAEMDVQTLGLVTEPKPNTRPPNSQANCSILQSRQTKYKKSDYVHPLLQLH